ncbi:ATP-binding cassette (ABC) Superfamily [Phytophthora palmivora]|uniref:ATP-binding cassette (ABC) Superfamily n=1 Tax=Phytophthora palmivora TaxID=4796 RepID=A0A2P4XG11_9STRA|nr:ATP-binding cassette (ABC) Superfamily [Phytophthora palmivora]
MHIKYPENLSVNDQNVSTRELFSYADGLDKVLMILGTIVLFGLSDDTVSIEEGAGDIALKIVYLVVAIFLMGPFK